MSVSNNKYIRGDLYVNNVKIYGNTIETISGDINILPNGSNEVLLKADPISSLGASTKQYVDNADSGLQTQITSNDEDITEIVTNPTDSTDILTPYNVDWDLELLSNDVKIDGTDSSILIKPTANQEASWGFTQTETLDIARYDYKVEVAVYNSVSNGQQVYIGFCTSGASILDREATSYPAYQNNNTAGAYPAPININSFGLTVMFRATPKSGALIGIDEQILYTTNDGGTEYDMSTATDLNPWKYTYTISGGKITAVNLSNDTNNIDYLAQSPSWGEPVLPSGKVRMVLEDITGASFGNSAWKIGFKILERTVRTDIENPYNLKNLITLGKFIGAVTLDSSALRHIPTRASFVTLKGFTDPSANIDANTYFLPLPEEVGQTITLLNDSGVDLTLYQPVTTTKTPASSDPITTPGTITTTWTNFTFTTGNKMVLIASTETTWQFDDTSLQAQITSNDTDIATLQTDLGTETTNRTNADANLQTQIDSNDTDIATLQTDLGTETTNRTNADTNLQNQIDSNDTDILNNFTELKNDYSSLTANMTPIDFTQNQLVSGGITYNPSTNLISSPFNNQQKSIWTSTAIINNLSTTNYILEFELSGASASNTTVGFRSDVDDATKFAGINSGTPVANFPNISGAEIRQETNESILYQDYYDNGILIVRGNINNRGQEVKYVRFVIVNGYLYHLARDTDATPWFNWTLDSGFNTIYDKLGSYPIDTSKSYYVGVFDNNTSNSQVGVIPRIYSVNNEVYFKVNTTRNLQTQITSNDTDIFTLTPQKLDITQTFTDTTKWDAANKSANVSITNGTINKPSDTSIAHAQSTIYDVSQDIDLEITINSLSGPSLYLGLTDIGNLGTANFANLNNNSNELFIIVFTTSGPSVYYRWKSNSQSIPLTTYFYKNVQIISPGDVIILKIRNTILSAFFNGEPLADFTPNTNYFNEEKFKLASNLYLRIGDDSTLLSDFNITLKESLPPLQSIDNRDTLYEVKYNPESNINLPAPQRIGQKLTIFNNQDEEQYQILQGSDIGNGLIKKMLSDNRGNIYIAGSFTTVNGATINRFAKYNIPTGTYSACAGGINDGEVNDMVIADNNLIILVGTFTTYNGSTVINRGKGILRYNINTDTFTEAGDGPDNDVFCIQNDILPGIVWIGGNFIDIDEGKGSTLANKIVQYDYLNDVFIAVPNATTGSSGISSGFVRDLRITADRSTVYLAGAGDANATKYDIASETFSSLGTFNQQTQHMELYGDKLYIFGEATTQITQNDATIKSINEGGRYDYMTDSWHQIVDDNFVPDKAVGLSEVCYVYALPNGEIILGGFFINKFTHISKKGRKNIGSGFTQSSGAIISMVYDNFSGQLFLGSNSSTLTSNDTGVIYNRIIKIPIRSVVNANFDYKTELILGDKMQLEAFDLNSWI